MSLQGCSDDLDKLQAAYKEDTDVLPCIRSTRLNLDVSAMGKKQEKDQQMLKQRLADKKKKRAEIGKGQQARKLKMMSLRVDVRSVMANFNLFVVTDPSPCFTVEQR